MTDSPHGISALIEKKLQEERKLIVDWILDLPHTHGDLFGGIQLSDLFLLAALIERGAYRKGEGE